MPLPLRNLLLVLCLPFLLGAAPSRTYTYTTGQTIDPSQVTTNEDNIYSYLQGGIDTYSAGSVNAAAIADGGVGTAEIATDGVGADEIAAGAVGTSEIATDGVGAAEIAAGAVDVVDMATTGTAADDKAFVADSSSAGTWRTVTDCTDTGGNHLNYTQSTNSFSCGTSSSTTATVAVGSFTRDQSLASATQTVSGLGLTPSVVIIVCGEDSTSETSVGISNSTTDGSVFNQHAVTANTWFASTAEAILTQQTAGNSVSGDIGNFAVGAFDIVWTKTGTPTGNADCTYAAYDF